MVRKIVHVFISILLLLPLLTGTPGFSQLVKKDLPSFEKPCDMDPCDMDAGDMDHSNPYPRKCPFCPSSSSSNLYFYQEAGAYLPVLTCSFVLVCLDSLTDQEFVKTIFRPPTLLL